MYFGAAIFRIGGGGIVLAAIALWQWQTAKFECVRIIHA